MVYAFGPFTFDTQRRELYSGEQRLASLSHKAFDVLLYLLTHHGEWVTRDTLIDVVWAGAQVTDEALTQRMKELRRYLGDNGVRSRFIETKRGLGYRFIAPVAARPVLVNAPFSTLPPFVAGPPITHPRLFFGRQRELQRLFRLWRSLPLQNAAIVGPRRSGKTSLLLYLQSILTTLPEHLRPGQRTDWVPDSTRLRWVFVDFQEPRHGSREGLLRFLLASLDLPVPTPCDLDRFMEVVSQRLRTPTVILFDEIGVALQRYPTLDNALWDGLRALATHQVAGSLAFVIAAGEPPAQLAHAHGFGSPFFNIFGYTATLGPLTELEARELIASASIPFPDTDVAWILTQSRGWPLLVQLLCQERLITLEAGDASDTWRTEGLRQIAPFRFLLASP
jgi:DNA-binding winged helix-turn-helix (wHTH) protein